MVSVFPAKGVALLAADAELPHALDKIATERTDTAAARYRFRNHQTSHLRGICMTNVPSCVSHDASQLLYLTVSHCRVDRAASS